MATYNVKEFGADLKQGDNVYILGKAGSGKTILAGDLATNFDAQNARICAEAEPDRIALGSYLIESQTTVSCKDYVHHELTQVNVPSTAGIDLFIIDNVDYITLFNSYDLIRSGQHSSIWTYNNCFCDPRDDDFISMMGWISYLFLTSGMTSDELFLVYESFIKDLVSYQTFEHLYRELTVNYSTMVIIPEGKSWNDRIRWYKARIPAGLTNSSSKKLPQSNDLIITDSAIIKQKNLDQIQTVRATPENYFINAKFRDGHSVLLGAPENKKDLERTIDQIADQMNPDLLSKVIVTPHAIIARSEVESISLTYQPKYSTPKCVYSISIGYSNDPTKSNSDETDIIATNSEGKQQMVVFGVAKADVPIELRKIAEQLTSRD